MADLVPHIEGEHPKVGRTSAVRIFTFRYYRDAAAEAPIQGLASVVVRRPPLEWAPRVRVQTPEPPRLVMTWRPGVRA